MPLTFGQYSVHQEQYDEERFSELLVMVKQDFEI
jgi:hypothetical protein